MVNDEHNMCGLFGSLKTKNEMVASCGHKTYRNNDPERAAVHAGIKAGFKRVAL